MASALVAAPVAVAKAFSPGHITGFFEIDLGDRPDARRSCASADLKAAGKLGYHRAKTGLAGNLGVVRDLRRLGPAQADV